MMIQPGEGGPKESIRAAKILCIALVTGMILFATLISILCLTNGPVLDKNEQQYGNIFLYMAAGLALVCILGARSLYNKKLALVKNSQNLLIDKLNQYRTPLISYLAPCEGAGLFSIVALFMTGNFLLLIITAIMLLAMLHKFPFTKKVISELNLDWKEQQELI